MIIFITGPQGSGKTTIANEIASTAEVNNLPRVWVEDDTVLLNSPTKDLLISLKIRQLLGLITVFTSQSKPPTWLTMGYKVSLLQIMPGGTFTVNDSVNLN